jgi:hypothetical protein
MTPRGQERIGHSHGRKRGGVFQLQVVTSEDVDAHHILLMLPSGRLPELRALLLEQIGQHQEALRFNSLYPFATRCPFFIEGHVADSILQPALLEPLIAGI